MRRLIGGVIWWFIKDRVEERCCDWTVGLVEEADVEIDLRAVNNRIDKLQTGLLDEEG